MINYPIAETQSNIPSLLPTDGINSSWRQQGRRRNAPSDHKVTQATSQASHEWKKLQKRPPNTGCPQWGKVHVHSEGGGRGPVRHETQRMNALADTFGGLTLDADQKVSAYKSEKDHMPSTPTGVTPTPTRVIINAHLDDIHGFLSLSPETFVSGSKDCTLKMWNTDGSLVKELSPEVAKAGKGYKYWITALTKLSESHWASGTRDGHMTIWNSNGEEKLAMCYTPSSESKGKYVCKDRNKTRINCITPLPSRDVGRFFYTGTPKFVQLWDGWNQRLVKYYKASENDWPYCIEVLENQDLLVVIGSNLEYWGMNGFQPVKSSLIQEETGEHRRLQRPHISAITRLEGNSNHLASALFDGSVKVIDIPTKNLVRKYREHEDRVWSVINLTPESFASSADDRTIKIWDIRQERSVKTIIGGSGRVSSLLKISANEFISGSCPDDLRRTTERANISFWDIRTI